MCPAQQFTMQFPTLHPFTMQLFTMFPTLSLCLTGDRLLGTHFLSIRTARQLSNLPRFHLRAENQRSCKWVSTYFRGFEKKLEIYHAFFLTIPRKLLKLDDMNMWKHIVVNGWTHRPYSLRKQRCCFARIAEYC